MAIRKIESFNARNRTQNAWLGACALNIVGTLIHVVSGHCESVKRETAAMPGVEVHTAMEGRLVVTLELEDDGALADTLMDIQNLRGVLAVAIVYHHYEKV